MSGVQILDVLEQSFSFERGVLQVSGMVVSYDAARSVGEPVVAVTIGGKPLEPGKTYSVTTLDFLAFRC